MQKHGNLTLILHCNSVPAVEKIKDYQAVCGQIIFICSEVSGTALTENFSVISQVREKGKVAALNTAIQRAEGTHILWLHEGEAIPELPKLQQNTFCVARVNNERASTPVQNWQIRLIPNQNSAKPLFKGFEIPEIYSTAKQLGWRQSHYALNIQSGEALFPAEAIEKELDDEGHSIMHTFWQGMMSTEKKGFSNAIRFFNKALKQRKLAPWNELAALNSLANAYMEIYKLHEACKTAKKSLEIAADQRAPYLTLYQYYNLKGDHKEAYKALKKYVEISDVSTKANWDVYLPKAQATFLMAEISLYLGRHENAFNHYKQFFNYHNGSVSDTILEKLLIYSIELEDREKAICYFKELFGTDWSREFEDGQIDRIKEALSLFADKNWYGFVDNVYEQLVAHKPEDERLRNGWIRMLVKNDEIQRAQALF